MKETSTQSTQSTQPPLTQADLQRYLDQHAIQARLIPNLGHTPTVPAAAEVLGVEPDQIIKTLLFVLEPPAQAPNQSANGNAGEMPSAVVVIGNGENRISKRALGEHFGLNPKRVKLAPADVVVALLGYPPGGVPPFGHRTTVPVIVDQRVTELRQRYNDRVFGGGGDDYTMLELTVGDLLRIHQPTILPLAES